jgi:hypothetical protein
MKETLAEAVGFRLALPNLQILAVRQFQIEFLERGFANTRRFPTHVLHQRRNAVIFPAYAIATRQAVAIVAKSAFRQAQ